MSGRLAAHSESGNFSIWRNEAFTVTVDHSTSNLRVLIQKLLQNSHLLFPHTSSSLMKMSPIIHAIQTRSHWKYNFWVFCICGTETNKERHRILQECQQTVVGTEIKKDSWMGSSQPLQSKVVWGINHVLLLLSGIRWTRKTNYLHPSTHSPTMHSADMTSNFSLKTGKMGNI